MILNKNIIGDHNSPREKIHEQKFSFASSFIPNVEEIIKKLADFQVAIPSWALGSGGTRFGRFTIGGEPSNLEQKIEDIGLLNQLNRSSGAISLHIPWDIPSDYASIKALAAQHGPEAANPAAAWVRMTTTALRSGSGPRAHIPRAPVRRRAPRSPTNASS